MTVKDHSEHVVSFSLVPIRGFPNVGDGFDVRLVLAQKYLQPETVVMDCREKVVIHFETGILFRSPVGPANISEHIEAMLRFKKPADVRYRIPGDNYGHFAVSRDDIADPIGILNF